MRILVVEDDYVSRKVLAAMLAPWGEVDTAVDGTEALGKIDAAKRMSAPYDLICLDIMMPGLDGREVLKEVRKEEERQGVAPLAGIKIVMVTAISSYSEVASAFREQCDGYVAKPINASQLEATLVSIGFPKPLA